MTTKNLPSAPRRVAVVGAGWSGLAAAARAVEHGHQVTLFEAARTAGGRARPIPLTLPGGTTLLADNGQHIMIGAYTETLALMRTVGADPKLLLRRLPLTLRYPDNEGLALPRLPRPLDAAAGILTARGWGWRDRVALLRAAQRWRRAGFVCDERLSVAALCEGLPQRVVQDFIEPLCVAALNTPLSEASASVFLRVLQDALLGPPGSADLLLPRTDLGALFPEPAVRWLQAHGASVRLGERVNALHWRAPHWRVGDEDFDRVVLALSAPAAAQLAGTSGAQAAPAQAAALQAWSHCAAALQHEAIATVYALADVSDNDAPWSAPMLALRSDCTTKAPAQFVFDRTALAQSSVTANAQDTIAGPDGTRQRLLAFVASAIDGDSAAIEAGVTQQARKQLGLRLHLIRTVTEKRATFACTPGLRRPPMDVAPGLLACGDFIHGPYPATLEGAVRNGLQAAEALR